MTRLCFAAYTALEIESNNGCKEKNNDFVHAVDRDSDKY